ncbi:MAG: TrmH family RNA methyltransferase [Victivallaceae bacterium]|nr:TrmH family RNA methyltransferase [Victivallaceae bacterium]
MAGRIVIVLDRLRSAYNTGNIFRIAEAVGAAEIIACGYTPAPPHPKLARTAMGADALVPCRVMPDAATAIRQLRKEGVRMVLAAEYAPGSVSAWEKKYEFPLAIVFGNEALGVSKEALDEVDGLVSLPMLGRKSSINVGNAAAAIMYGVIAGSDDHRGGSTIS